MRMRGTAAVSSAALAVVLAVVATGCATPPASLVGVGSGVGAAGDGAAASAPAELAPFYGQELAWGSCAGYSVGERYRARTGGEFSCARLTVPLDYSQPESATAEIAVIKLRGRSGGGASLVVNPGGPGASGLEWALGNAQQVARGPLGERLDIVSFDPRGVGASTPRIECRPDAEIDALRAQDALAWDAAGIAEQERRDEEFIDACVANTGVDTLANMGTNSAVRDLDVLRAALGDERLTYLGFSYGTGLGTDYALAFPGRVRAMVLDGAVDPDETPAAALVNQLAGFQRVFDEFARDCARVSDCALGPDPDQAVERFRELIESLRGAPAATNDSRGLSEVDAETGVIQALYSEQLWGSLRLGLAELAAGRGDTLLRLADLYAGRDSDGRYQSNTEAAFTAIRCADESPGYTSAELGEVDAASRAAAPFLDDGRGSGAAPVDICDLWPVLDEGPGRPAEIPELPQLVVVSTTEDPATPHQAGVDLAALLGAALITVEGATHTAVFGNDCVDAAVADYLIELRALEEGLTCPS